MNLFGTVSLSPAALDQGPLGPSVSDPAPRGPVSGSAGTAGTADQIAFLPAVPPAAAAAVLVVGIAAHVERLLHAPPNPTVYAQIEADCRKQFTEQLQRLPGLSAQGMQSAQRAFDGFLANLKKIKISGVGDVAGAFKAAVRDFPAQLSRVFSPGPAAQPQAGPRSRAAPAAGPAQRPGPAARAHQPAAAPQLSAAQMAQLKGVRSQAGALKAQAQAGQPLTAAQLAQGGPARELAHLRQDITALLRSASPALAAYRHELQRTQAVAAGHAAGLYRITAHKAIAGSQQYTEQALKALHGQARTVMRALGDDQLLEKLYERLRRGEPTPPAQLTPAGQQQSVTHTNTAHGAVTGESAEELNGQARKEQAKRLEQAARQAYEALKTGLPGRDWKQHLTDLARGLGLSLEQFQAYLRAGQEPEGGSGTTVRTLHAPHSRQGGLGSGFPEFDPAAFSRQLVTGRVSSKDFEAFVREQWHLGPYIFSLPGNLASSVSKMAFAARDLHYAEPTFSNTLIFGSSNSPAGNLVQSPSDPSAANRRAFRDFLRGPHMHKHSRIGLIVEGNSTFYTKNTIAGRDFVVEAPVYKNDLILWPGGTFHTFATQEKPFYVLSCMTVYSQSDLEGKGIDALSRGIDFDVLPRMDYGTYLNLKEAFNK